MLLTAAQRLFRGRHHHVYTLVLHHFHNRIEHQSYLQSLRAECAAAGFWLVDGNRTITCTNLVDVGSSVDQTNPVNLHKVQLSTWPPALTPAWICLAFSVLAHNTRPARANITWPVSYWDGYGYYAYKSPIHGNRCFQIILSQILSHFSLSCLHSGLQSK